jgi:hypothetical protein
MKPLDDPAYRKLLLELVAWLEDGTEAERLEKLRLEVLAKPQKRAYSRYRIKNADGSVRRHVVKSRMPVRKIRVRSELKHPLLKVVDYLVKSGYLDSLSKKPASFEAVGRPKSRAK